MNYTKNYYSQYIFLLLVCGTFSLTGQIKFLMEDFEGFSIKPADLKENGVFTFGGIKGNIENNSAARSGTYLGRNLFKATITKPMEYGGWGQGLSRNMELDRTTDYISFYVRPQNDGGKIKIELQEDDNGDNVFKKEHDDQWVCETEIKNPGGDWQLVSVPLSKFSDSNPGGDGAFNVSYKQGKLFTYIISFDKETLAKKQSWDFDFVCFSKGKLPTGKTGQEPPSASKLDLCNLGAWSPEGNQANFSGIATAFEEQFKSDGIKKLGIVHFFQPFSVSGSGAKHHYPSVERINQIIKEGYIPMITLEDHFVNAKPNAVQPNLYSIFDGHYDSFFGYWASQIKEVKGKVLLRILHEFNGDWYPWCTANNDQNPELVAKAFRYIHNIFRENNVTNVSFIWCPNSMSVPQQSWNYIMDAYPGDKYVDYVGLDIYNGAGTSKGNSAWRSFRKEGIENYFVLTQKLPDKPLLICETASRERRAGECSPCQGKAEWIEEMAFTLKTDMSRTRLLAWFNEKETFRINSTEEAKKSFSEHVMKDGYFKSGTEHILPPAGN